MIGIAAAVILAYLIGAIPTGYIVARLKGIADIRKHGSGNIGATNVSRILGWHYFFLIFFLDAGKAFLFLYLIIPHVSSAVVYECAVFLLIGNGYSFFLSGSGGKGVATLFGLIAAFSPTIVGLLLVKWCFGLLLTRTVGIASVGAAFSLPVYAYLFTDFSFFILSCFFALWIMGTHRSNLRSYWEKRCAK